MFRGIVQAELYPGDPGYKRLSPSWEKAPPAGNSPLWVVWARKDAQGNPQEAWSEPELAPSIIIPRSTEEGTIEYLYRRANQKPDKPAGITIGGRKIDFHSFRHIYASRMADRMAADKVAKVTGHRSKASAKIYQDHLTAKILEEATNEAMKEFGNVLQFVKLGA